MRFIPMTVDLVLVAALFAGVRRAGNYEFRLDRIKNIIIRWILLQLLFVGDAVIDVGVSIASNYPTYFERKSPPPKSKAITPSEAPIETQQGSAALAVSMLTAMVGGASEIIGKVLEQSVASVTSASHTESAKITSADGTSEVRPVAVPPPGQPDSNYHMKLRERGQRNGVVQPGTAPNVQARSKDAATHTRGTSGNPWGASSNSNLTSVRSLTNSANNLSHPPPPPRPQPPTSAAVRGDTGFKVATNVPAHPVGASLSSREAEIERREAELRHREARLNEKESKLEGHKAPNFPVCKPLIYHSIQDDIPQPGQWLVKRVYYAWYLSSAAYLANFVAAFSLLVVKAENAGGTFGLALVIFLVGIPVSFVFWYRPLYSGVKNDRSISFFLFYFNYGFHLAVSALLAVGIPGWGGAGVIYCLSQIGSSPGAGILCAIASGLLIFEVVYGVWQMKAVSGYYRSKGLTAEQAKQQALSGVASSSIGREFAGAALRSSMAPDASRRPQQ
ncbi:hypothetical protein HDU97_004476 [Phlyctochytrium planicorne]|nr:hypothetical protein HDU97_004476 [Phlyctochytrium planicorne]